MSRVREPIGGLWERTKMRFMALSTGILRDKTEPPFTPVQGRLSCLQAESLPVFTSLLPRHVESEISL